MTAWEILLLLALALAVGALALALVTTVHYRRLRDRLLAAAAEPTAEPSETGPLVAFVANPSKPEVAELRGAVERACGALGLSDPLWLETTTDDPGVGQARTAVDRGASVVVAVGGDGTVRAVAEALTGTGVPMGLLPLGTGNLLARNLDIPVADLEEALLIALEGRDRTIDVGWLEVLATPGSEDGAEPAPAGRHLFLVIAGLGFDAAMVADTDARLKAKVGWMAYFIAGIRHLHGRRLDMQVALGDDPPVRTRLRTILIGNCGRLPGGITLIPDAVLDDGLLDIAAIDTRGGIAGWAQLFGEVVLQGFGVRSDLPNKIGRIDHTQCRRIGVQVRGGAQVQVDGDIVGAATAVESWVEPASLVVRAPRKIRLAGPRATTT